MDCRQALTSAPRLPQQGNESVQSPSIISSISAAEHYDIILEDGLHARQHAGNIRLGNLIIERQSGYKEIAPTNKLQKNNYICNILGEVRQTGGKFLRYHPSGQGYKIADDDHIYKCIQRRLLRKKQTTKQVVPEYIPPNPDPSCASEDGALKDEFGSTTNERELGECILFPC